MGVNLRDRRTPTKKSYPHSGRFVTKNRLRYVLIHMFSDRIGWTRVETGVGVDFGASAVKLVALARDRTEIRLAAAGREPLPIGAVRGGSVRDMQVVGDALRRLAGRLGVPDRDAAVGVGGRSFLVKRLELPEGSFGAERGDLRHAVAVEAARQLPVHMDDVLFDYQPAHGEADPDNRAVTFGGARREIVLANGRSVVRAGLGPRRVEIEPYGLLAAMRLEARIRGDEPPRRPVAVLDVGESHAATHVFQPRALRNGDPPTLELVSSLQAPGGGLGGAGKDAPNTRAERLRAAALEERIGSAVAEALGEAGEPRPEALRLAGGGASRKDVRAAVAPANPASLDPVGVLDPERGDPSLAFAAGLAFNHLEDA